MIKNLSIIITFKIVNQRLPVATTAKTRSMCVCVRAKKVKEMIKRDNDVDDTVKK